MATIVPIPILRSGRAVAQTLDAQHQETAHPLCNGLGRGVELAGRGGLAEAVIHNGSDHGLSTFGCQRALLCVSIRFVSRIVDVWKLQR